jgi:hypothetical protein
MTVAYSILISSMRKIRTSFLGKRVMVSHLCHDWDAIFFALRCQLAANRPTRKFFPKPFTSKTAASLLKRNSATSMKLRVQLGSSMKPDMKLHEIEIKYWMHPLEDCRETGW